MIVHLLHFCQLFLHHLRFRLQCVNARLFLVVIVRVICLGIIKALLMLWRLALVSWRAYRFSCGPNCTPNHLEPYLLVHALRLLELRTLGAAARIGSGGAVEAAWPMAPRGSVVEVVVEGVVGGGWHSFAW
jgi:hypothetical protein